MINIMITGSVICMVLKNLISQKSDFLKPANIFTIIILFTYLISCLHLSNLQHRYSVLFTFFILSLTICFYLGTKIKIDNNKDRKYYSYNFYEKRLKIVIYCLFFIVVTSFLLMWKILGAPPLISKADRATYFVSGFGTLYLLEDVVSYLLIYDFFDRNVINKKMSILMISIIIIMLILMSNKFQIIYLICQFLAIYNYLKSKIKIKTFIKFAISIILLFIFYYSFIYNDIYISNEEMYKANKMNIPYKFAILTNPYMYVACNYENLYYYTNLKDVKKGYGYYAMSNILEQFNMQNFFCNDAEYMNMQWQNKLQYKWLTTGTVFREFFMDFGYLGIYTGTILIAMWTQYSYKKYRNEKSIFGLYLYITNIVSLFLAFFTNNFISINYLINIICACLISRFCYKSSLKERTLELNKNDI